MKQTTGYGEEETVRVARNGEDGPKRVWKPATRRRRNRDASRGERGAGKWILHAESAGGAKKLKGVDVRKEGGANRSDAGKPDREADEVLEGECKVMSGTQVVA